MAEVDVTDPADVVRQTADAHGLVVVARGGGWAVELPGPGWRRIPGPSVRQWLRERVAALTGAELLDVVALAAEDVLVTRAIAREQLAALEELDRIRAAMRTDEIGRRRREPPA